MPKRRDSWLWIAALLIAAPGVAQAPPTTLEQEVANLNRSLRELVALLRAQTEHQRADLVLRRVELSLSKLGPLRQERKELRAKRDLDQEELTRLEASNALRTAVSPGEPEDENLAREIAARGLLLEFEAKRLKTRLNEADLRLSELDADIAREEKNLEHWEATLERP